MAEMVTFNEETILAQGEAIYSRRAEIEAMADAVTEKGFSGILISSSGGSQAMLAPFSAMIDELSDIPWRAVLSAELVLTGCNMVDEKTLVLMTSKSGDTTETLAAARWLKERGCTIFSVIGKADSPLEEISDFSFVYGDGRPQELIVYLFLGRLLYNAGCFDAYPTFADELANLVPGLVSVRKQFDARARAYCERYHDAPYHIWVSSGDIWPTCYAYAMCVLEESQWIRTKSVSSPEFFHGTLELLEKDVPLTLLVGEGSTRALDLRVKDFAEKVTDELTVIDAAEFDMPGISAETRHWLGPVVMNAALQRISKNMEDVTSHSLDIRRYYRKLEY